MFILNGLEFRNYEQRESRQYPLNLVYYKTMNGDLHRIIKPGAKVRWTITLLELSRTKLEQLRDLVNDNPNGLIATMADDSTWTFNYTGENITIPDHNRIFNIDLVFEGVKT